MISNPSPEWALRGPAVVTPDSVRPAAVVVRGERIAAVVGPDDVGAGVPITDVGDKLILPGLVDTHVHINEPGRTDWEGFETATRAAAAGGITTVIDMPLNSSPVTTTISALEAKRQAATGKLWVDVGIHGGVVPGNVEHVRPLIREGVCAFKAFLCPSGIDEFPAVSESDLRQVMPLLADAGIPLFVHAELVGPLQPGAEEHFAANPSSYQAYLATRPPEWEVSAIRLMIDLCRENRCPVHIVHLSAAELAMPLIEKGRAEGLPLTVETCPHYLYFTDHDAPDGDPRFKCAPPIRDSRNAAELLFGIAEGILHTIGSDHSPAPPEIKHLHDGNVRAAWGGIASVQLLLPATQSALARQRFKGLDLGDFLPLLTDRPARLVGLADRKGAIVVGRDADLIVFDPDAEFTVTADILHFRHKVTPYLGQRLRGRVETTYLRGRAVFHHGEFLGGPGGQLLRRTSSAGYWQSTVGMNIDRLNSLPTNAARDTLLRCCGSLRWADDMAARRPFRSEAEVFGAADEVWFGLDRADWTEAFAAHPRIGDIKSLRKKFASTADWASREQAGVVAAHEDMLRALAECNQIYETRFGHIFIVCATGKTATEMLALLSIRLRNDPDTELRVAAAEQAKITRLRLEKL
jgi:allantoinase